MDQNIWAILLLKFSTTSVNCFHIIKLENSAISKLNIAVGCRFSFSFLSVRWFSLPLVSGHLEANDLVVQIIYLLLQFGHFQAMFGFYFFDLGLKNERRKC